MEGEKGVVLEGKDASSRRRNLNYIRRVYKMQKQCSFMDIDVPDNIVPEFLDSYKYKPLQAIWSINKRMHFEIFPVILLSWILWKEFAKYNFILKPYQIFFLIFGAFFIFKWFNWILLDTYQADETADVDISKLPVAIVIPVYNEDKKSLVDCIIALLLQTRRPNEIHITDDGSGYEYQDIKEWFCRKCEEFGVIGTWARQENLGKREAHCNSISRICNKNSIVCTIDSDATLDPRAIEEGMKPFAWSQHKSVTGLVISKKVNSNFLTRIVDSIPLVSSQHLGKGSMSGYGCVVVNSGAISLYRPDVIAKALEVGYQTETYNGEPVHFSDDSFLTLIALSLGKTIFQPSCFSFADMPITLNHHLRQYTRWARGAVIRGFWRVKFFPFPNWVFIVQFSNWASFFVATMIFIIWGVEGITPDTILFFLITSTVFCFLLGMQYSSVKRIDVSKKDAIINLLLLPLSMTWQYSVLRIVNIYAMFTHSTLKWGTRQSVEKT
jgi:hyaluronan synthase